MLHVSSVFYVPFFSRVRFSFTIKLPQKTRGQKFPYMPCLIQGGRDSRILSAQFGLIDGISHGHVWILDFASRKKQEGVNISNQHISFASHKQQGIQPIFCDFMLDLLTEAVGQSSAQS